MEIATVEVLGDDMVAGNAVSEQIRGFILEKFPLARKQGLKSGDKLLEGGILDSLGVLDLVSFVEQEFAIQISDDELVPDNFQTIEQLAAFVQAKSGCESPPLAGA
jgi:acyl carrier protein